jgi:hypothetical protein
MTGAQSMPVSETQLFDTVLASGLTQWSDIYSDTVF